MKVAERINPPPDPLMRFCSRKRKASDDEDEDESATTKRGKYSWYVTLESESSQPSDEDDESIYSVQDKETDWVRDTSDTSTDTWISDSENGDVSVHVEYEVASLSENENPLLTSSSASDSTDLPIVTIGMLAAICDSDLGLAADSEESRSSVDSEIGRADYWTCVQCNARNNNPLFRYCEKCYQTCWQCRGRKAYRCFSLCQNCYKIRKNFFPPRPKWKRRRSGRESSKANRSSQESRADGRKEELTSLDSGLGSSQESKSSLTLDLNLEKTIDDSGQIETPTSSTSTLSKDSVDPVSRDFPSAVDFDDRPLDLPTSARDAKDAELSGESGNLNQESNVKSDTAAVECRTLKRTREEIAETSSEELERRSKKAKVDTDLDKVDKESGVNVSPSPVGNVTAEYNPLQKKQDIHINRSRKRGRTESDAGVDAIDGDGLDLASKAKNARVESDTDNKSCLICTIAPKNGAFVHGGVLHICSCYRCAMKVWRTTRRCPICNRKITNVLKAYYI